MPGLEEHVGRALADLADEDPRIRVIDGDLADSDGADHFQSRHPDRFHMGGIAEQNMVSMAAGMASCGARPWVFSFGAFLCYRAYDQIRVGLSQANQPVTLVGAKSGGLTGKSGMSHASLNDLAAILSLPNVQVWAPADECDVQHAVRAVHEEGRPAYLRLSRADLRSLTSLGGPPRPVRWLTEPASTVLCTYGVSTQWALESWPHLVSSLPREIGHVHMLSLRATDDLARLLHASRVRELIVFEDHGPVGGLGSYLLQTPGLPPIRSLCWPPGWTGASGDDEAVCEANAMSGAPLAERARQLLAS